MSKLTPADKEQLEELRPIVQLFAECLFATVTAASLKANRMGYVKERDKADEKWQEFLEAVAEFAVEDH